MQQQQPKYFRLHRVYSNKHHSNGTILQSRWSDRVNDYIYEVNLDIGKIIWATHWSLTSENRISWFVGDRCYSVQYASYCIVRAIHGFNKAYGYWLYDIELIPTGQLCKTDDSALRLSEKAKSRPPCFDVIKFFDGVQFRIFVERHPDGDGYSFGFCRESSFPYRFSEIDGQPYLKGCYPKPEDALVAAVEYILMF